MTDVYLKASTQYGVKEVVGDIHNPIILEYFKTAGHAWVKDDELAWCSAFVNWAAIKMGYEATKKLNARSWLDIGTEVIVPNVGDIVIFWRKGENSAYGHVGFYVSTVGDYIYVLGGNQKNQVCIQAYPKSRLLGFRRLSKL